MTKTGNLGVVAAAAAVVAAVLAAVFMVLVDAREAEASFPGNNGKIAFASNRATPDNPTGDYEIFASNPDGTALSQLTFNTTSDYYPTYSPNGARIAYSGWDGHDLEVFTIPASGGTSFNVTNNAGNDYEPSYSPSGQRIAYSAADGSDEEIFTISASGGTPFNVTDNSTSDYEPAWSPSGQRIAYRGSDSSDKEIFTIPVEGGTPFNLTNNVANDYEPSYSPNGQRIAYRSFGSADSEIFTISASGGAATNLTNVADNDYLPAWSPDGTKIAFQSNDEIYTMNASDGSNQTNITNTNSTTTPALERDSDWQPNTAPSTTGVRPTPGSRLGDRTPTIRAVVRDTQTDLAHPDIKLYLDGRVKPFSYSQATNRLSYATGRLSFGKHTVRIVARDDVGLSRTGSWRFRVVR